ncbi:MAG: SRPBCC family protein [Runella sp.]
MKINLSTVVSQPLDQVWKGFDESLFRRLAPPFPPVRVVRFDGCMKGDWVELELNFLLFKQRWTSLITDQQATPQEVYFIDEGTRLPFFLSYWHHKHRLVREGAGTKIIDEIEFRTPFVLTDYLMYPLLWVQFAYRKPIYRRIFR